MQRALEGLGGVDSAEVDLTTGEATVRAAAGVSGDEMVRAVRGKVILSWARGVLARLKRGGRP